LRNWTRNLAAVALISLIACGDNHEGQPDAQPRPACSDGKDNDGDGLIDFPKDPGCVDATSESEDAPIRPQCSDNRDNDGDGLKDYPNDPGCITPQSDVEEDDCPNGPYCPQCANGVDDDASGAKDFPLDPGCESAADNFEYAGSSAACGAGLTLKQLPASGTDMGTTNTMSVSNLVTSCGGGNGAPAIGYIMVLNKPSVVVISTLGSTFDTVLDLRKAPCMDTAAELECHDNVSSTNSSSQITRSLAAGVYYIIVEGKTATQSGAYVLTVQKFRGEGELCTVQGDCGPGLVCRVPVGGTQKICTKPVCSDGLDDDGDGKIDHPSDPGCDNPADSDETDDCPNGPNCPDCSDGVDNDNDGNIDFPADPSCKAAGDPSEACNTSEPITAITQVTTQGDTTNAVNDYDPPCNSSTGTAKDLLYRLDLPAMQQLTLNVAASFDAVHTLLNSSCGGTAVACSDPALMTVGNLAAGTYYLSVEGWSTGSGPFTITTGGTIAVGGSCEGTLYQNGAITCPGMATCVGAPGARRCVTECADGIDNNGDGKTDFPADPGCSSPLDGSENTVCPGASCPQCADGIDNDNDGATDYPADTACAGAGSSSEACNGEHDPVVAITTGTTTDSLVGATDDHDPSCVSPNGPDKLFSLDLPAMATLQVDTIGSSFDTVLSLLLGTCAEPSLACNDEGGGSSTSKINLTNVPAGSYFAAVDAYSTNTIPGPFTVHVSGTVALGGSCEGALFQSGALTCIAGTVCDGLPGARRCSTQCSDGIDNNGDGLIDWPTDPGCASPLDAIEDTVCPGATCPACADGTDNDGDGLIDWPADTSCPGAGGSSESCPTTEPIGAITTQVTNGTTVGATNDYDPTCNSTTGLAPDVVYRIDLPPMALLNLNVLGFDTVTTLFDSSCVNPLVCSDPQLLTTSNLPGGTYFVSIEGYSTTSGAFTLTTTGQVAPGGSCEGALFQSGAFTCTPGFVCDGVVGARTCRTQCSDGIDNNGDGRIDYPYDPGCTAPNDNSEATVCPGASCPACSDGVDNDGDGRIDYPSDPQCYAAGGLAESCVTSEGITPIVSTTTTGSTTGLTNDYKPTCGSVTSHTAPDAMYAIDVPQLQSLTTTLTFTGGLDGVTSLIDATCSPTPIACSDPATMTVNNLAAGRYFVVVDGSSNAAGPFTLTTAGVIAPGGSCESPLVGAGVLSCATGTTCQGPAGAKRCVSQCSDGIDNNGDGRTDFPFDPGCDSLTDNTEASTCPGAGCPVCGNASDDDGDSLIDFPADFGCKSAAGTTEVFCAADPDFGGVITQPTTSGTLVGAAANYNQTCQSNTGADVAYALSLPVLVQTLRIDTFGSAIQDTVLAVKDAQCSAQLGCNDDAAAGSNLSALTLLNVQPGNYAIQVDSYNASGANTGAFKLNVRGTVSPGTRCTSPLFATGVLACGSGTSCAAGVCQ
jgi:hypothetical protein